MTLSTDSLDPLRTMSRPGAAFQVPSPRDEAQVIDLRIPTADQQFSFDVAIVGLGYVGLPTALAFQAAGRRVIGIDVNPQRIEDVGSLRADLLPTDMDRLRLALVDPSFALSDDPGRLAEARTVIVCVPTPVDHHLLPDLSILRSACATVVEHASPGQILILTSTTYVGCTQDLLVDPLALRGLVAGRDLHVAFSPERIDPGNDSHTHEEVPRVVGGVTAECTSRAAAALGAYATALHPVSSPATAEMTKLLENTFRAVNIALANEFGDVCRAMALDVIEVVNAAATKPYGFMAFRPGPGVGGHCIPCDPHYLLWQLREHRMLTPVIDHAMKGIAGRPAVVVDRVRDCLSLRGMSILGARVLVVGVAYKPDVQDVRESPALDIIAGLRRAGAHVAFHDPLVPSLTVDGHVLLSEAEPQSLEADIVLLHTAHRASDLRWLEESPLVLDATYTLPDSVNRHTL